MYDAKNGTYFSLNYLLFMNLFGLVTLLLGNDLKHYVLIIWQNNIEK